MTSGRLWVVILLMVIAVVSGIGVSYAEYQTRKLFAQREALRVARDQLAVEWRQQQLELATFAAHGRVESMSREKLGMRVPSWDEIRFLEP